jgi:hypothetical protein
LVEKQQKCQKKQQEDQQQQRSGTHQYQENRSVDSGCEKQDNPPAPIKHLALLRHQEETKSEENIGRNLNQSPRKPEDDNITKTPSVPIIPLLSLRPQEENKPEASLGRTSTQSPRKPEVDSTLNAMLVSIPLMPLTVAPTTSPTTHFSQQIKGKKISKWKTPSLSTQTEKNSENDDKITPVPRVKKQERVRKRKNKASLFKTQVLPQNEIKLIPTRNDFQTRQTTILTNPNKTKVPIFQEQSRMEFMVIKQMKYKNKNDHDLLSTARMMSNWELNLQKHEDPENLDKKGKIPKVANIMHKKIQQEEGTKDKERVEIPSITRRKTLEHGRPPEDWFRVVLFFFVKNLLTHLRDLFYKLLSQKFLQIRFCLK